MFHWICPECGREIPPVMRECPACDPQVKEAEAIAPLVAAPAVPPPLPEAVPEPPSVAVETIATGSVPDAAVEAVPQPIEPEPAIAAPVVERELEPELVLDPVVRMVIEEAAAEPEPVVAVAPEPEPDLVHDPVVRMVIEEAAAEPEPIVAAALEPEPELVSDPVVQMVLEEAAAGPEPQPELVPDPVVQMVLEEAAAAPDPEPDLVEDPLVRMVLEEAAQAAEPVAEAEPGDRDELADIHQLAAAIDEYIAANRDSLAVPEIAVPEHAFPWPPQGSSALQLESAETAVALLAPPPPDPAVAERMPVPEVTALAPAPTPAPPPAPIPAAPARVESRSESRTGVATPALPFGPLLDYSAAALRRMRPAAPIADIRKSDVAPRITLPGPALPRDLNSLQEAGVTGVKLGPPQWAGEPTKFWRTAMLAVVGLLSMAVVTLMISGSHSQPKATPAPATDSSPDVQAATITPVAYTLAKNVEVTGFRIGPDTKKPEIHYLVVNHSAAALSNVTVYVTLRTSTAKAGQPPLLRFTFRSPSLGPLEAKEMASPIDKLPRAGSVPDWQDLRADVALSQ